MWTPLPAHHWSCSEGTTPPYPAGLGMSLSSVHRGKSVSSGPGSLQGARRRKCWWLLDHTLGVLKNSGGWERMFLVAAWFTSKLTMLCFGQGTGASQTGFSRRRCTRYSRGHTAWHGTLSLWGGGWSGGQECICRPGLVWWLVCTIIVLFYCRFFYTSCC